MTDPYSLLKIPTDATSDEIAAAYERMFDKYEARAQAGDERATAMLDRLNAAYDALNEPTTDDRDLQPIAASVSTKPTSVKPIPRTPRPQPQKGSSTRLRASQPIAPSRQGAKQSQTLRARARTRDLPAYDERPRLPLVPIILLGLVAFGLAAVLSYMLISRGNNAGPPENRGSVVATVNNQPIYEQDFLERAELDKQGALSDPIFGGYIKTLSTFSQTQALETLRSDSLDRLINFEVLNQQARKEGLYPETAAQQSSVIADAKASDLKGANFADFLKARNLTEGQYNRRVVRNVVYTLMADAHMAKTGTDDARRNSFFQWICQTRANYDVKINVTFAVSNPPCTSDLPPELALPGLSTTVPEPLGTAVPATAPGNTVTPAGPQGPPAAPSSVK